MGLLRETVTGMKAMLPVPRGGGSGWSWSPRSSMMFGRGLPGEREYRSAVGDGSSNSICEATIMWIARNFPEADPVVLQTDPNNDIPQVLRSHPLAKKLRRPNYVYGDTATGYSGVLLWMGTMVSWNIDGNAYWLKRRTPSGALRELWYIPHFMIEPRGSINDGGIYVDHYDYRGPDGTTIQLDPVRDVFHMRYGIDPDNPLKGRSPLRTAYRELFTDEKGAQTTAALLANLGVPGLVISPTKDAKTRPTDDEKNAIKARYQQSWGNDRIGEPIVMSSPTEVSQFGFNPEQLSLAALRDIPEERVTALLGVPAAVVGFGTGLQTAKVGATMSELRDQAFENCLIPTHRLAAGELDIQMLPEFVSSEDEYDRHAVAFDLSRSTALVDATQKKATIHSTLVRAMIEKRGEARGAMGMRTDPADDVFVGSPGVIPSTGKPPADVPQPTEQTTGTNPAIAKAIADAVATIRRDVRAAKGIDGDLVRVLEHIEIAAAADRKMMIEALAGMKRDVPVVIPAARPNMRVVYRIEDGAKVADRLEPIGEESA